MDRFKSKVVLKEVLDLSLFCFFLFFLFFFFFFLFCFSETVFQLPSGEIVCSNGWPLHVTVELTVKGEGGFELLDSLGGAPRKAKSLHVLPAFSDDVLLAAVARQANAPKCWSVEYRGAFGASLAVHDDQTRYRWPFDGGGVCEQSFGGDPSKEGFHSCSFALYAGTSITAARRGTVMTAEEGSLQICHGDGSVATYSCLAATGVHEGQTVKEGDVIGTSTETLKFVGS
jgi:hypothetical protein